MTLAPKLYAIEKQLMSTTKKGVFCLQFRG